MISLSIENFELDVIIGLLDFERLAPQRIIFDGEFEYRFHGEHLDYVKLCDFIEEKLKSKKYLLLEDALIDIANSIKKRFLIEKLTISIKKPTIKNNCILGAKYSL